MALRYAMQSIATQEPTSPLLWVALVTGLGALGVLIWQAVRYFRNNRDDD